MITTVTLNPSVDKLYLVEKLAPGGVARVGEVHNSAGGKGLNAARAAALLGEPVLAAGILGGFAGGYIRRMLEEDGVRHDFVEAPGETRSCINIRERSGGRHTELLEPGQPVPPACLEELLEKYSSAVEKSGAVVISGSTPPGTPVDFYGTLVKIARERGRPVILDTSGENLRRGVAAHPTMVKPNAQELAQLLGEAPRTLEETARAALALRERGVAWVVVSLGKEGAVMACPQGLFRGRTPDVPVANTVGCGDAMTAAFGVAFARGYGAEEALGLALAASTANALSLRTGWFLKTDLDRLLGEVSVERLKGPGAARR